VVAYTPEFCLPYMEGTDSPCAELGPLCDKTSVWCELAGILDGVLTTFDDIKARAVDSFPYAQVGISALPYVVQIGDTTLAEVLLPWDSVLGDSDNMADLSVDPYSLTLRRPGVWNVVCEVVSSASLVPTNINTRLVTTAGPDNAVAAPFSSIRRVWLEAVPDPGPIPGSVLGVSNLMDCYIEVDVSNGPAVIQIAYSLGAGASFNVGTIGFAQFSARWVADPS
jgi:hypothetical protein